MRIVTQESGWKGGILYFSDGLALDHFCLICFDISASNFCFTKCLCTIIPTDREGSGDWKRRILRLSSSWNSSVACRGNKVTPSFIFTKRIRLSTDPARNLKFILLLLVFLSKSQI